MEVHFDVALSIWFETYEGDYHYDDYDENIVWMMVHCRGNLDKNLDDFESLRVSKYNGKSRVKAPIDDSLVPIIPYEKLDEVATAFLRDYYPDALRIPMRGRTPVWVDPTELAKNMGLTVRNQCIREEGSIFGQIYFDDTDTEMYNADEDEDVLTHIKGRTIVADPMIYLLRNLGSFNNTIIHECIHWAKHRKVFKLEQLFNADASYISCEVVGDSDSRISIKSTKYIEKQANQLAPRIQMPKEPFTVKAKEYIARFMRQTDARHTVDVMEMVIGALERDYGVSRQAVKIRLVELGFEEAICTFNYVDGHYVKPHGFRKGAIKVNQTFTLSAQDAAIQRFVNPELREKTANG
ncbi:MAG: ImmA/IrrE family metallo-endopeptidase, partial [Eubacteriales bacterium]|nr:ImmA/IrrE family metallo-endopeptidase [Eubacteriales bacterium]